MVDATSIWIAVIVAVPTVLATTFVPIWLKSAENKVRATERREDKEALERAAAKAEEVAIQAKEAARLLAENTIKAEAATKSLTDKVDVVHTLVNSNLTIATQKLLEARQDKLKLLVKYEPKNIEIDTLRIEIAELDVVLLGRLRQARAVENLQALQSKE